MPRLIRKRLHRGRDRSLGFTLLEILVVLALVGILSGIVAPSWLAFSINQSLNSAQSRAFSSLRSAQSEAKRTQVEWQASFRNFGDRAQYAVHKTPILSSTNAAYWNNLPWEDFDSALAIVEDTSTSQPRTTFTKLSEIPEPNVYRVQFNSKGVPSLGELGRITFAPKVGDRRKCVIVSTLLGSIRLAEGSACNQS